MNAPAVNIIDTIDDRDLFEPWFPEPSWNAWRVILKPPSAFRLTMASLRYFARWRAIVPRRSDYSETAAQGLSTVGISSSGSDPPLRNGRFAFASF